MDFLKGRDGYIKNGISGWKKGRFYRIKTICNGSVNARPRLEPRGEGGNRSVIVGPRSTTRRGNSSRVRGVPLEGPSRCVCMCVSRGALVLSLSMEEGRSTFGIMAGI